MSSRRNYLTIAELEEYANITVTDETEAYDQISQAEEIIDAYVGFQQKAIEVEYRGKAVTGSKTTLTLQLDQQNLYHNDYFKGCTVEIIGGTGAGEQQICLGSTKEGVLTTQPFVSTLDNTSVYRIYQLGKFPRFCDDAVFESSLETWYKFIPEKVKRAVACQVEYKISMGESFFSSQKPFLKSESIGDYSYTKGGTKTAGDILSLVSPKAQLLLRGIKNITGQIEV